MTRIIQDLEHGAVILIHDLAGQPTPGETVPEEALGAVKHLAFQLGLEEKDIGPFSVGYLFDLLNHGIEAISASADAPGHAQAGAPTSEAPAVPETEVVAPQAGPTQPEPTPSSGAGGEVAVGGLDPTQPATTTASAPSAAPAAGSAELDDIVAKAQQQWGGGGAPVA